MSKAEKHPSDEGKYQATFNEYGHGEGNGKSRAAIYKHHKKWSAENEVVQEEPEPVEAVDESDNGYEWSSVSWLNPDDDDERIESTIPNPVRKIASGETGGLAMTAAQAATQQQLIRWGFMGLDRGVTHWGRGVMSRSDWELERSPEDYDALEGATTNMLEAHGISLNLSPELVWGTVVGAAYIPPLVYIGKNADPNKKKGIIGRIRRMFKRRRLPRLNTEPINEGENNGNSG